MPAMIFTDDVHFTAVSGCTVDTGTVTTDPYSNDCSALTDFTKINEANGTIDVATNPGEITIQNGAVAGNPLTGGAYTAPGVRLDIPMSGDFDVRVKVTVAGDENVEGAALGYYVDDDNHASVLRFWNQYAAGDKNNCGFEVTTSGNRESWNTFPVTLWNTGYLRLTRSLDTFAAYYKENEGDSWTQLSILNRGMSTTGYITLTGTTAKTTANNIALFDDLTFDSGLYGTGVFDIHTESLAYIDAGTSNALDYSTATKTDANGTFSLAHDSSNDSAHTPSRTDYTWAEFLALPTDDLRYNWIRGSIVPTVNSVAATFSDLSITPYVADVTPPAVPTLAYLSQFSTDNYAMIWTEPADADFSHCELRRIVDGVTRYLGTGCVWQESDSGLCTFADGDATADVPHSNYIDEDVTGTSIAYSVRSVDGSGNASAWVAFEVVSSGDAEAPSTPSVSFAADGTSATVSGADSGTTNTIYVQSLSGGGSWVDSGSVSGNGDVSLTLDAGSYWGMVSSANASGSAASLVSGFMVTGGDSNLVSIAKAVRDALDAGSFSLDFTVSRDYAPIDEPTNTIKTYVTTGNPEEQWISRSAKRVIYPIKIGIIRAVGDSTTETIDPVINFARELVAEFSGKRLATYQSAICTEVLVAPMLSESAITSGGNFVNIATLSFFVHE